jgi:predicted RecB family nuclease
MGDPRLITSRIFAGYLQCKTKGQLLSRSAAPRGEGLDIVALTHERFKRASVGHIQKSTNRQLIPYGELRTSDTQSCLVDCDTTYLDITCVDQLQHFRVKRKPEYPFVPILFLPHGPMEAWHKTLLCFSAIAICEVSGEVPLAGYICHGSEWSITKIRLRETINKMVDILTDAHRVLLSKADVPLILNKHCGVCQFRLRCRRIAIDTDNLSLIGTLGDNERRKLLEKGISTITQLSYGYRPRRKRRIHAPAPPAHIIGAKNDNKLKALALKKQQIHVVNAQHSTQHGTPVYLDVEGMPGEDFFYLIGMRYRNGSDWVEHSLWANTRDEERVIWAKCVERLDTLERPCIIHYGHFEKIFLKRMKERYSDAISSPEYIDDLIIRSRNLLTSIYGSIYFPTYTNGLKEIAGYLGFRWSDTDISGSVAPFWRRCWELTSDETIKAKLFQYNMDDCKALEIVAAAVRIICAGACDEASNSSLHYVDISSLEVPYQRTFGKFCSTMPDFQRINEAAYWDYQRQRVFVRSKEKSRSIDAFPATARRSQVRRPDNTEWIEGIVPVSCRKCQSEVIWKAGCQSQTVTDLIISRKGIRRRITRYAIQRYRCGICRTEMGVPRPKTGYGLSLRAYVIYLLIEMRLSHQNICDHLKSLFGLVMNSSTINDIKCFAAAEYEPLYRSILRSISSGDLVHSDETKGVVYGGGHYIWIFANFTTVAYVYSATRDADVLRGILQGFSGVLVSDFYGAYEAIECPQQRCLIHLMRDINEAVLKNPFNSELSDIASRFGTLLRAIVDTIDRWGLKAHHLRKHKPDADRFFAQIEALKCSSEAAVGLRKRLLKNRTRLFTFLDYDGVPWNNNNAEHAVRAFTRLRNTMATSTVKGTKEYAILLSIQQTLKYRNIEFLDFLRSGRKTIEGLI